MRASEDHVEAFGMLEIPNEEHASQSEERDGEQGRYGEPKRAQPGDHAGESKNQGDDVGAGRNRFGPGIEADAPIPRYAVRDIIAEHSGRGVIPGAWMSGDY